MKKLCEFFSSLVFALALLGLAGTTFSVSAQTPDEKQLADFIKIRTNRTFDGLIEQQNLTNGGVTVDLQDRFQNLMLSRLDADGNPVAACVTDLGEANSFFGINLETGALLGFQTPFEKSKNDAARHGMTVEEMAFYQELIKSYQQSLALNPQAATITIVNNDGAGEGFNDTTAATPEGGNTATTLGAQRLAVFQAAAAIWSNYIDSSVTIQVRSQFDPLTCSANSAVLGSAGTRTAHRDFPNAEFTGTWYHQALANKRAGSDLSASEDINATFNSTINNDPNCLGGARFYLGLDNLTPSNTTNLLVVLLHEFSHGLGFSNFANGQTGVLFNGLPDVYVRKIYDRTVNKYWTEMSDAERAASAINPTNVLWDGANVKIASGFLTGGRDAANGRVLLYTPSTFSGGSSVSHWSTQTTPNLLMEPFINVGLPLTLDLTPNQMRDVGWFRDTNLDLAPDTITNVTLDGGAATVNSTATVRWTNNGGFNKNVTIELSTDGGVTYATTIATNVANTGSYTFTVPNAPTTQGKIRVREANFAQPVGETGSTVVIRSSTTVPTKTLFDFDGDRKTDISIFRPSNGQWWYLRSSDNAVPTTTFGSASDKIVPADFTGDGKTDIAFWRESTGEWYILRSEDSSFYAFSFGTTGDKPVPADFDGDGKADPTVFRPSNSVWYSILSSTGAVSFTPFGISADVPMPSDFDGDGKADFAVFRPAPAEWWIQKSTGGTTAVQFGTSGDKPVPADYTGDGKTDIAFFRPGNANWYIVRSEDSSFYAFPFGLSSDVPVPGDYDGDGKADPAIFRASNTTWYLQRSTSGFTAVGFGLSNDKPVATAYQP